MPFAGVYAECSVRQVGEAHACGKLWVQLHYRGGAGLDDARLVQVSVLEMDGAFDKLEELIYVESHLSNTSGRFYGEVTQQMLKNSSFPGSTNGTGLFQTICGLKIREVYERITQNTVQPVVG